MSSVDDYQAQRLILQHLRKAGQNYRRIKFNIHIWGLQFDGGIISNSGNPVLVWNLLGKSNHTSSRKHRLELKRRGIREFEISIVSKGMLLLGLKEMVDYVKYRRQNKLPLSYPTEIVR